jgi:two-component system, cell cycle response regulator
VLFVLKGPEQGAVFSVPASGLVIGRERKLDVSLTENTVSRAHARLCFDGDGAYVEDLSSRNGTFVNDQRVDGRMRLNDGDHLRVGDVTIIKFALMDELEEHALRTLFELTLRDPLTRLHNRRYFDDRLKSEFSFARRHDAQLALLLVDIDHFKDVNDNYGHQTGDLVLKLVANAIRQMVRPEDVVARYGGEEFIVIARDMSLQNARILGERMRRRVGELALSPEGLRVTVSVGVTAMDRQTADISVQGLVAKTDEAMYQAKRAGRDRVCAIELRTGGGSVAERSNPRTLPPSRAPAS